MELLFTTFHKYCQVLGFVGLSPFFLNCKLVDLSLSQTDRPAQINHDRSLISFHGLIWLRSIRMKRRWMYCMLSQPPLE